MNVAAVDLRQKGSPGCQRTIRQRPHHHIKPCPNHIECRVTALWTYSSNATSRALPFGVRKPPPRAVTRGETYKGVLQSFKPNSKGKADSGPSLPQPPKSLKPECRLQLEGWCLCGLSGPLLQNQCSPRSEITQSRIHFLVATLCCVIQTSQVAAICPHNTNVLRT